MEIDAKEINENEQKFLDHIKFQYPAKEESVSLFQAVEMAFFHSDANIGLFDVPIVNSLVTSLARCNLISLNESDHDVDENAALLGVLKGLLATAVAAYYKKALSLIDETYFVGSFPLPNWFQEYVRTIND